MKALLLATLVFLSACSTMRLNYQADVKSPDGREAQYTLKKSYPVGGGHQTLCILTGIFMGGYCWFYLTMPTKVQSQSVEDDAHLRLAKAYGSGKYEVLSRTIEIENWREEPEDSKLSYPQDVPAPKVETSSPEKK